MDPYTEVGCEAYIVRGGKLLLGKRSKQKYGPGTWGLPGGHMKFMERADDCIIRELKEEIGINVRPSDMDLLALTDGTGLSKDSHHLHVTFRVNIGKQVPKNCEPDECDELKWFPVVSLPDNILPPHILILETIRSNKIYKFKQDNNA